MKYLVRFISVFLLFFVLSICFFAYMNVGLTKYSESTSVKYYEMYKDNAAYDVLILGTSRTYYNIDVQTCENETGERFYNLGIAGSGGYEIQNSLKGFLAVHPKPKTVILNIDGNMVDIKREFHNPTVYFNSLENKAIYESFNEKGYPAWLYKNIPFTRVVEFNDDIRNNCLRGHLGEKDTYVSHYHGYLPMRKNIGKFDTIYKKTTELGHLVENYQFIDSVFQTCKRNKIELIFVVTNTF